MKVTYTTTLPVADGCLQSFVPADLQLRACEGQSLRIDCGSRPITIITAAYGRFDNIMIQSDCGGSKTCSSYNLVGSTISMLCNGRTSCNVAVNNDNMGGDPCYGVIKSLNVWFNCGESYF